MESKAQSPVSHVGPTLLMIEAGNSAMPAAIEKAYNPKKRAFYLNELQHVCKGSLKPGDFPDRIFKCPGPRIGIDFVFSGASA